MREPNDWRLNNQERYLKGVVLAKRTYSAASAENDHDHCEFCGAKFMVVALPNTRQQGYATVDGYRWVCCGCFEDFSDTFEWHVATDAQTIETYTALLTALVARGATLEEALANLRTAGATPIETIKAIRVVQKVSLGEAKQVFGNSQAWAAEVKAGDALHGEVLRVEAV